MRTFEAAAVDARVSHIQEQARRVRTDGIDGVAGIGGGSAMCTAKGIACMATNEGRFTDYRGYGRVRAARLPTVMVRPYAATARDGRFPPPAL